MVYTVQMTAELFIGTSSLVSELLPGVMLAAGLEGFEVFPVNPDPNFLEHTMPVAADSWTHQLLGLQCGAGDQTFVFDPKNEKIWSEQTAFFRDNVKTDDVVNLMKEKCGAGPDVPIS
jgi:hypothetical protein